ncbi:MAG: sugar phosphate isomerase/epimerase [Clostridia bacterium]|nr:sugar phosphate isomerase/epimerase [Clostridia bacterium]
MKIGVCRGLDDFEAMNAASGVGIDYWETGFGCLANFDDEKIEVCKNKLEEYGIKCLASNGFIPGDMPIVGTNVDYPALCEYMDKGFERAKLFGIEKIVLGSGKARSFEEGFCFDRAEEQVAFFLEEFAAPRAKAAGCIIVIEPLRFKESSIIHTVSDGVRIAKMSKADNVFGLADLYHVYGNKDSIEGIAQFKDKIKHAHIAEPVKRNYPLITDDDNIKNIYKSFFDALKKSGCDTCSVEARTDDFANDIKGAVAIIKSCI